MPNAGVTEEDAGVTEEDAGVTEEIGTDSRLTVKITIRRPLPNSRLVWFQ
jgi:hypothetical protein